MLPQYIVKHVMSRCHVQVISEYDSVAHAITLLDDHGISAMPVQSSAGRYVGVISKSDIASVRFMQALQRQHSPDKIYVKELMNRTVPLIVNHEQRVQEAIRIMFQRHIHRVFVVDSGNRLCGTLSTTDILKMLVVEKLI